jgi:phenylalanyl-tRNA synthetase beta chain
MKISYRWLREHVEVDLRPEAVADRLVNAGIEVAEVSPLVAGLSGVVVAEIEAVERELGQSPAGYRLTLCRVVTADQKYLVVCGAPNATPGARAAFAPPGAALPGGRTVQAISIRGQRSEGMLCSEKELGLGEDEAGILLLPRDAPLGTDLVAALGLDDWILEVEITPNRPDCLSVVGIAREVAALTGAPLRMPSTVVREGKTEVSALASVLVEAPDLCPRYTARVITGLSVGPSPLWLAQRLRSVGLRPINNLVDVTNYVLWELGHPLHAFDYDALRGHRIVVRRARAGERITTLDGQDRALTESMLLIADAERGVGLAGVMGGANSEVTAGTTTVLLESAYFDPVATRRTSRALGLSTEAAYRFERGADIEGLREALDRAAQLIADLGGGIVARGVLDQYPSRRARPRFSLRFSRIRRLVGNCPPREELLRILRGLGFTASDRGGSLEVEVPSFRRDLIMEDDLVEEVIRVWGYERIPSTLPSGALALTRLPPALRQVGLVRQALVGAGLSEVITMSLVDPDRLRLLGWDPASPELLTLRNPLSQERSVLRPTLAVGLLETLAGNLHRQIPDLHCFEVGRVFRSGGPERLAREEMRVAVALTGLRGPRSWFGGRERVDLYDAKGIVELLLETLGLEGIEVRPVAVPLLEEGRAGEVVVLGEPVGTFGEVALPTREAFDLANPVYYADLSLDRLRSLSRRPLTYRALPRFPAVQRDLALVVPQEVSASEVGRAILEGQDQILRSVMLFDVYTGDQIGAGRKSMAYTLIYQADDRTLTDAEVNRLHEQILARLRERFGAEVRGPEPGGGEGSG